MGNVALFRTCALYFLVAGLSNFSEILIAHFRGSGEDAIYSGIYIAIGIIPVIVSSLMLAKKNALLLKIWAAIVFAGYVIAKVVYVLNFRGIGFQAIDFQYVPFIVLCLLNTGLVLCVFSFVAAKCKSQEADTSINMNLLRLCSVFALVYGLSVEASFFFSSSTLYEFVLWGIVPVMVSIFSLIRKNAIALELFAVMFVLNYLISGVIEIADLFARDIDGKSSFVPWLLQSDFVVFGASFFIDREQNRRCIQKIKLLLGKWEKLT